MCVCVCDCMRALEDSPGDEKLTQANFTAFIFILLVKRPSVNHAAPHRRKKIMISGLRQIHTHIHTHTHSFFSSLTQCGAEITPQGHGVAASLLNLSVCPILSLSVFLMMKDRRKISGKYRSTETWIHGQGPKLQQQSQHTSTFKGCTHISAPSVHPSLQL